MANCKLVCGEQNAKLVADFRQPAEGVYKGGKHCFSRLSNIKEKTHAEHAETFLFLDALFLPKALPGFLKARRK